MVLGVVGVAGDAGGATERNLVTAQLPSERNGSASISRGGQDEIEISFDSSTFADCDCGNETCYGKHKVGRHWPIPSSYFLRCSPSFGPKNNLFKVDRCLSKRSTL